tara:strand:+ start:142 stop:363 length:222 start_codon:yes stop_codon:yes gene_type:complete
MNIKIHFTQKHIIISGFTHEEREHLLSHPIPMNVEAAVEKMAAYRGEQLSDEEVAHDDLLPEQWQGRCPWTDG